MSEYDSDYYDDTSTEDSSTVEFPDGTEITDPYTDASGQVYETHDDYIEGSDPYEADPETGEADPVT